MKRKFLKKIIVLSTAIILAFIGIYIIFTHRVYTELNYCKELGRKLSWLNMKQYNCLYIKKGDNKQTIRIDFELKSFDNYSSTEGYNESIYDIGMVKKNISEYLKEHPDNELNDKKIICTFNNLPGEQCYMYNYDYRMEINSQTLNDFCYFKWLYINISTADNFKDAHVIELIINKKSELSLLKEWNNLEELHLSGIEFSKEDKQYLINLFPNCTIICNGETLNAMKFNNKN